MTDLYAFILTMASILLLIPLINFVTSKLSTIPTDIGVASLSLLTAYFCRLLTTEVYSEEILFLLILATIFHGLFIPCIIILQNRHKNEESQFFAITAFPLALFLSQSLLYITALITVNGNNIIIFNSSGKTHVPMGEIFNLIYGNMGGITLIIFSSFLVLVTLIRFVLFKQNKSITGKIS
uniref:Uncharacterized protein n=1 Tax=Candidatus Kentrum sp. LFY TaxID=2126342 RepID=A0A450WHF6_9GAMM|nr:MAG: hypothetical protein BECKLFY1418C_GA0070996_102422 [Candidatus Kentron sp. LFY]